MRCLALLEVLGKGQPTVVADVLTTLRLQFEDAEDSRHLNAEVACQLAASMSRLAAGSVPALAKEALEACRHPWFFAGFVHDIVDTVSTSLQVQHWHFQ